MRPALIALFAALVLAGCETNNAAQPSPLPPNAMVVPLGDGRGNATPLSDDGLGVRLDQVLAVVEGEPLRLRTLARRLGIEPDELEDEANQREIMSETMKWAKERVFVKAAERVGLVLSEPRVDSYVMDRLERELERASEEVGQEVTREEFLESEGVTWPEYRTRMASELLRSLYIQKLLRGVGGGTRPQIDLTVPPSEVRTIYARHRGMFDVKAGVRLVQFKVNFDRFEQDGRDFFEVDELTTREAGNLAGEFQTGRTPAELAVQFELGEEGEGWNASGPEQFVTEFPDPTMEGWLLDATRSPGHTRIVPVPTGMLVFGILERREERRVPYEEAYAEIVKRIQLGRMLRLEHTTLIELVTQGNVVWPDELADALLAEAHTALRQIAEEDVWKGARLR